MKDNIINALSEKLKKINIYIYDIEYEKKDNENNLIIIIDSIDNKILTINDGVMATRIINPILDKLDPINESYVLDVYARKKEI